MSKQAETIKIEGMSCQHCVHAVRTALENTAGVEVDQVEIGTVRIQYDPAQISRSRIEEVIEEEGYVVR